MINNLLIIFTRNPELGKVKTRLAAKIGDSSALEIYKFLLQHTVAITKDLQAVKQVHYSEKIQVQDIWDSSIYYKNQQVGFDLGNRMDFAFQQGFNSSFEKIIIIGSDMYDLSKADLENAFSCLEKNDVVLGPAEDGGYYLLGMKKNKPEIFQNKKWGTKTVFSDTINDLKNEKVYLLPIKNDIDIYEDIESLEIFQQYLQ